MTDKDKLQSPFVLQFYIDILMETDGEVADKLCSMNDFDRVCYLHTFKNHGESITNYVAKDLENALKDKFTCTVNEPVLVDVEEINTKESTFVAGFYVDIEYHFDESERVEPNQAQTDLENVLRKNCPSNWTIN